MKICANFKPNLKKSNAQEVLNIENQSFRERQFLCRSSRQGKLCGLNSYFSWALYIDEKTSVKNENECVIYKKNYKKF